MKGDLNLWLLLAAPVLCFLSTVAAMAILWPLKWLLDRWTCRPLTRRGK